MPVTAGRCCIIAAATRSSSDDLVLTPARRRGVEILDDPHVDPAIRERSLRDVVRSNRVLGGLRAAALEIDAALQSLRGDAMLLDIGSGLSDIPARAIADARRRDVRLTTIA